MQIKKLSLKNFRNYEEEEFEFSPGLNVLFGKNAQGKTNCAEAVFYLCTGSSLRIRHDRQLIRSGAERARIAAVASNRFGDVSIEADIGENSREIRINGSKISKNADLLGNVNSVFFSPGELRLIQDGPDERRRFLNLSLSQLSRGYYTALLRYNKILEQRNALLKNRDVSLVLETLPVWDEQLCLYAARVACARAEFVARLAPLAAEAHAFLTDGAEALSLGMDRTYQGEEEEIAARLLREMSGAYEKDGVVQKAIAGLKENSDMLVIADLCLCEYTDHGHCGVLDGDGYVMNDETIELYGRTAVSQAEAGADIIAPSGMMDGQIAAIRIALDDAGFKNVPIMAYSAKFYSAYYGPFRDVANSAPGKGNRAGYQMPCGNRLEAMREIEMDVAEGADMIMVKPAGPYLDIIRDARERFDLPLAAYQVSGEYAMIKAAAQNGWIDEERIMMESLLGIKRAGADIIITYFAREAARLL